MGRAAGMLECTLWFSACVIGPRCRVVCYLLACTQSSACSLKPRVAIPAPISQTISWRCRAATPTPRVPQPCALRGFFGFHEGWAVACIPSGNMSGADADPAPGAGAAAPTDVPVPSVPWPESRERKTQRFTIELEFVQCLGNPLYLSCAFYAVCVCVCVCGALRCVCVCGAAPRGWGREY